MLEIFKCQIFGDDSGDQIQIVGILFESEIYPHLICNQNVFLLKIIDHSMCYCITYLKTKRQIVGMNENKDLADELHSL